MLLKKGHFGQAELGLTAAHNATQPDVRGFATAADLTSQLGHSQQDEAARELGSAPRWCW